jgi:hypothetical protein
MAEQADTGEEQQEAPFLATWRERQAALRQQLSQVDDISLQEVRQRERERANGSDREEKKCVWWDLRLNLA